MLGDRRLWFLLAGTALTLSAGWFLKAPCLEDIEQEFEWRRMCFNDIELLYYSRGLAADPVPYVNGSGLNPDGTLIGFSEYPVLTGLLLYVAALLSDDVESFFAWNVAMLSVFALATTILLFIAVPDRRRVAYWAAAPPLTLYAFHNWDLLAILCATAGLFLFVRGKMWQSGLAIALGGCAKLYPLVFLPILGLALLAEERRLGPRSLRFGLGAFGGLLGVNGPFILLDFEMWKLTYTFHAQRTPNFETVWWASRHFGDRWGHEWAGTLAEKQFLDTVGLVGMLLVLVGLGVLVTLRRMPPIPACFVALLAFLLLNKVFSIQYTLWVMPFFALLSMPTRNFLALVTGDVITYVSIFTFFQHFDDGRHDEFYHYVGIGVYLRATALLWILIHLVRQHVVWSNRGRHPPLVLAPETLASSSQFSPDLPSRRVMDRTGGFGFRRERVLGSLLIADPRPSRQSPELVWAGTAEWIWPSKAQRPGLQSDRTVFQAGRLQKAVGSTFSPDAGGLVPRVDHRSRPGPRACQSPGIIPATWRPASHGASRSVDQLHRARRTGRESTRDRECHNQPTRRRGDDPSPRKIGRRRRAAVESPRRRLHCAMARAFHDRWPRQHRRMGILGGGSGRAGDAGDCD